MEKYEYGARLQVGETMQSINSRFKARLSHWRSRPSEDEHLQKAVRKNDNRFHVSFVRFDDRRDEREKEEIETKTLLQRAEACVFKFFGSNVKHNSKSNLLYNVFDFDSKFKQKTLDNIGTDYQQVCIGYFLFCQLFGA